MKNPTGSSDAPKCKLCAAFVALDMPSLTDLELPGTARFSRDSDICDACLKYDDAARVHLLTVEQQTGLVAGLLLAAFIALLAVIRLHNQLPRIATNMPPLVRGFGWFLIIMLAAVLPCAMLVWLVMQALFNLGIRCADRGCATKTAEDANRFYWLAVWGGLTGHGEYYRRMLKKATATGLPNQLNLSDPRLQLATQRE